MDLNLIYGDIKKEEAFIKHINEKIASECGLLEQERGRRKQIKDSYKKQLMNEYNRLVNRLNIMAVSKWVQPKTINTFEELAHVHCYQFNVADEMEQVETENE